MIIKLNLLQSILGKLINKYLFCLTGQRQKTASSRLFKNKNVKQINDNILLQKIVTKRLI